MKYLKLIALGMICLTLALPDVSDAKPRWRSSGHSDGFDGFGGFFYGQQGIDFNDLKTLAHDMGIESPDNGINGWGGYGMGHLGNGWRIGGLGFGYDARYSGVYTSTAGAVPQEFNRAMQITMGGGGFLAEFSPWMIGPVNFGVGTLLGWGGIEIRLTQDDGTADWQDLTGQYTEDPNSPGYSNNNINTNLTQSFILINPYVTARIHILDWMALAGQVGYNFNTLDPSKWTFFERELPGDASDMETKKMFYRIGLVFGG